ncbi:ATP synthase F0 subunit A [Candidatus Saccharibacteria bacterium RIFCSPHIGHO2_12_FULL_47_16b]|nr:MAG: ATP synthase F0 subunit A [Candidatus Saccharibacteria bacterium RIFCSPHIGHO2_12_FULL_47_16b]
MVMPFLAAQSENVSLSAEKLFSIGPFNFTNSMLFGIIAAIFVLVLFGLAAKASQIWPKSRLAFYIESFVDMVFNLMTDAFGDRKQAMRFFPLLLTLFVFILAGNLSGLLPGVGSVTVNVAGEPTSLLRAFTTDLNSTLAMAVLSLLVVHVYALRQLGFTGRFRYYFSGNLLNPMNIFIGLNELFGEVLRLVTLSLRLFGVIYGGEALLHAISALAGNFAWAATLPIMFLEIFFSLVQAYLFMMLTATYLVTAVSHEGGGKSHEVQPAT